MLAKYFTSPLELKDGLRTDLVFLLNVLSLKQKTKPTDDCFVLFETGPCYVGQAGPELETLFLQPPKFWGLIGF